MIKKNILSLMGLFFASSLSASCFVGSYSSGKSRVFRAYELSLASDFWSYQLHALASKVEMAGGLRSEDWSALERTLEWLPVFEQGSVDFRSLLRLSLKDKLSFSQIDYLGALAKVDKFQSACKQRSSSALRSLFMI